LFEQLGANAQRAARGPVAKSPAAELREHGYELDRGFGQAVARSLAGSRVLTGEQSKLDEPLESVGADVLSDPRVGPSATFGKDWLPGVHERQLQHLAGRREREGTPG
jgi:hypothetical protein